MPWCPKCKCEYKEGITECADCKVPLVDEFPVDESVEEAIYQYEAVSEEETEEQIEISHPFIDLTDKIKDKEEGEKVIAVPVFTDGFEMDKCYEGHHENMLYKFSELVELVDELGASGIIINCLGISYYMKADIMKRIG